MKNSVLLFLALTTSVPAGAAENTIGKWRVIEVAPDPVYEKKAGRFVSNLGQLEITTPDCFALFPYSEDEGKDPKLARQLLAQPEPGCKAQDGIKEIEISIHGVRRNRKYLCKMVLVGGGTGRFAADNVKIAGNEACVSARPSTLPKAKPNEIEWSFNGASDKSEFNLSIVREELPEQIAEMKRSGDANVPPAIRKIIDSIKSIQMKKKK